MAIVNRKDLVSILAQVSPGVGAKETILQETCFVFSEGYVYAYNHEICMSAPLPDGMADLADFAVQAKEFQAIVNKIKDESFTIEMENNGLCIKTKRAKAEIKIEAEIKMPISEIHFPEKWIPLPDGFSNALKRVIPAVSTNAADKLATCVLLHDNVVEASDVDKAARYTFAETIFPKQTDKIWEAIFLPRLPAGTVVVQFNPTAYASTEGWVHFKKADATLSCRLHIKGQEYVNIGELIKRKGIVLHLPKELPNALERAGVFIDSTDGTQITHQDRSVNIRIVKGWCVVYGEGGIGTYEESMKCDYDGDEIEFNTDVQTLVNAVAENQQVEICGGHIKIFDDSFNYIVSFKGVN